MANLKEKNKKLFFFVSKFKTKAVHVRKNEFKNIKANSEIQPKSLKFGFRKFSTQI